MVKIFVNGTFDVLHFGHIELLKYARSLGDYLLVAIDSDLRVKEKKGNDRPFNNQFNRQIVLSSIRYVDNVEIFNDDQQLTDLVKDYNPDFMIVGSDWFGKKIIGGEHAKQLIFFDRIGDHSTTKTIEDFINRR